MVCSSISVLSLVYSAVPKGIIAVTVDVIVIFVRDLVSVSRMLHASYIHSCHINYNVEGREYKK